jgi:eukaryotic-like serine/threonine-protein kinase
MVAAVRPVVNNRYELVDKLGQGGMGVVFYAVDQLANEPVALKRVNVSSGAASAQEFRVAMAQEFKTLATLRHPNVIKVLDYGFSRDGYPFFTMELLTEARSLLAAAQGQPIEVQIGLFVQLLQALTYLHRRGIIHRDLKPDNVLVVGAQNSVKVVDFGLATLRSQVEPSDTLLGTLKYMAPELLSGEPPSPATDLFAVGVMMYEVFTGTHPFDAPTMLQLFQNIQTKMPDLSLLPDYQSLSMVIIRLLEKDPHQRFSDANEVGSMLAEMIGSPMHYETPTIRESYLQSASFIGREQEVGQLIDALVKAENKQGSAWLIAGESGVGKSRLCDEIQVQALIRGALVLRGQAVSVGGSPYHMWRNTLRRLCLEIDMGDLEASVLKVAVPDISTLLQRDVDDAPELDAEASAIRFLNTIEQLFRRTNTTILLLLEDVHWSLESLSILKRLVSIAPNLPMLIVANYRDDEHPTLANELADMHHIKLDRLGKDQVNALVTSMLGDNRKSERLVSFLHRESEGNALFIVEVVRSLAEEVGQLERIRDESLPPNVFPQGIRTVVEQRLNRVPAEARELLEFAAVAGRELQMPILRVAAPQINLDHWLIQVATVIDVQDNTYRFAHEKLRDGLLARVQGDKKATIHAQIARAVESAYPNDPTRAVELAYHWNEACNRAEAPVTVIVSAIRSAAMAARQVLYQNAPQRTIDTLNRAFELNARLDKASQIADSEAADLHILMAQAYVQLGKFEMSYTHIEKAAALVGDAIPQRFVGLYVLREVITQVMHRRSKRYNAPNPAPATPDPNTATLVSIYKSLGIAGYITHRSMVSLYANLRALNLSERAALNDELPGLYALMANLVGTFGNKKAAERYYDLGKTHIAQPDMQHRAFETRNFYSIGSLYFASAGYFEQSFADLTHAAELSTQMGDLSGRFVSLTTLASVYLYHGDTDKAYALLDEVIAQATESKLPNGMVAALFQRVFLDLMRANYTAARANVERAKAILDTEKNLYRGYALYTWAYSARTSLYEGNEDAALREAIRAHEIAIETKHSANLGFYPLAAIAEVYLTIAERRPDQRDDLLKKADAVVQSLNRFNVPIGQISAWYYMGMLHALRGKPDKAAAAWEKGLQLATELGVPFEQGNGYRLLSANNADYKRRAIEIYEKLGATHYLNLLVESA